SRKFSQRAPGRRLASSSGPMSVRTTALAILVAFPAAIASGAEPARKSFIDNWQGKRVAVKRALVTLVYNERGKLGKVYRNKREALVVVTPSAGAYYQFDGRDSEQDIAGQDPQQLIDLITESYRRQASLDIGFFLRVEPLLLVRYEPGGALVVK